MLELTLESLESADDENRVSGAEEIEVIYTDANELHFVAKLLR